MEHKRSSTDFASHTDFSPYYSFICAYIKSFYRHIDFRDKDEHEIIKYALSKRIPRLHWFKRRDLAILPRVKWIIGIISSMYPESIAEFGPQRGTLLFPLMDKFPDIQYHAIDIDKNSTDCLNCVKDGGFANLTIYQNDVTKRLSIDDKHVDLVIMSEILEHLESPEKAVAEACRLAKDRILITVPSKKDTNPEHINLFTFESLISLIPKEVSCTCFKKQLKNNLCLSIILSEKS
jgi:hypothetical protein